MFTMTYRTGDTTWTFTGSWLECMRQAHEDSATEIIDIV